MKKIGAVALTLAVAGTALAGPGEGIRVGNLAVSPFVGLSITYDSNIYLTHQNKVEDYFTDVVPGVALLDRTESLILRGRAWGQYRNYFSHDDLDSNAFGERVSLLLGTPEDPRLIVDEKYVRLEDYEITPRSIDVLDVQSQDLLLTEDRTEREKRDLFDAGILVGRWMVRDKFRLDAGYGFDLVNYRVPGLLDWHENRGQLQGRYTLTERSSALLTAQYSVQHSAGFPKDSSFYLIRGGLLTQVTGKTSLKGTVGYENYRASFTSASGDKLDKQIVDFDLSAQWAATEKLFFELSGGNGMQPAAQYDRNTKVLYLAQLSTAYDVLDTVRASLAGSYRYDDYVGRIPIGSELLKKHRHHVGARARLDYRPRAKFYDLYIEGTYENVKDNLQDDYENYDQVRLVAGAFLRY